MIKNCNCFINMKARRCQVYIPRYFILRGSGFVSWRKRLLHSVCKSKIRLSGKNSFTPISFVHWLFLHHYATRLHNLIVHIIVFQNIKQTVTENILHFTFVMSPQPRWELSNSDKNLWNITWHLTTPQILLDVSSDVINMLDKSSFSGRKWNNMISKHSIVFMVSAIFTSQDL